MKQQLKAGGELDLLTKGELAEVVTEAVKALGDEAAKVRQAAPLELDAAGNGEVIVYRPVAGREFTLTRLLVTVEGYAAEAPYTNVDGSLGVYRGDELVDFLGVANNVDGLVIPALSTDEKSSGETFANGEELRVVIVGGPADVTAKVAIRGFLDTSPTNH